jgi:protein-tyrosine phosphatase
MYTIDKVKDHLFIGNASASCNRDLLKSHHISHILLVGQELYEHHKLDFVYKKINVRDLYEENISQYFQECIDFIENARKAKSKVFVHCAMGISRSTTIVLAYLMKTYKMTFKKALAFLVRKHPETNPNIGFVRQLREFEETLKREDIISTIDCRCTIY